MIYHHKEKSVTVNLTHLCEHGAIGTLPTKKASLLTPLKTVTNGLEEFLLLLLIKLQCVGSTGDRSTMVSGKITTIGVLLWGMLFMLCVCVCVCVSVFSLFVIVTVVL